MIPDKVLQIVSAIIVCIVIGCIAFLYELFREPVYPLRESVCPNASYVGMCQICNGYHFGVIEGSFTLEYLEFGNYEAKE